VRLVFLARVYCAEPECDQYFEREVEAEVSPVSGGSRVSLTMPEAGPAPKGWYARYRMVLCPYHNPDQEPFLRNDKDAAVGSFDPEEEEARRKPAPPDVVVKARKLQALAMDRAAGPGERENAWAQFSKLWEKYAFPNDLGFEEEKT